MFEAFEVPIQALQTLRHVGVTRTAAATVVIMAVTVVVVSTGVVAAEFIEFASESPDLALGLAAGPIRSAV